MHLVENLKWRYACKKYDASKKVATEHIDYIKEAIRLSASSYGMQPYRILEIEDKGLRAELRPLCWNQGQITDASHLFVFCNKLNVTEADVDAIIQLKAQINNAAIDQFAAYGNFVKGKLKEKTEVEMFHWTAKQVYIALGNALNACAQLQLDSTPIEGFEATALNEKLELHKQGLSACVLLAIGYRSEEDANQHTKKTRKPLDDLFGRL